MVILFDSEQVKCTIVEKKYHFVFGSGVTCTSVDIKYDFDRYYFEERSKEMYVTVDFIENKIFGHKIAYGEYGIMELDECINLLKTLESHEILRDFSNSIVNIDISKIIYY